MGQSAHAPPTATTCSLLKVVLLLLTSVLSTSYGHGAPGPRPALHGGPSRPRDDATSQEAVFPYEFEEIAIAAQNTKEVELGTPYAIKRKQPEGVARRRLDMQEKGANSKAQHSTPLARDDSTRPLQHLKKRPLASGGSGGSSSSSLWPSRRPASLTNAELNFVGILAAILVKLVLSTALATWFLAAGQALYGVASITGTTAVFGMDSTIGYIYKTLPYIEALLRGETTFH